MGHNPVSSHQLGHFFHVDGKQLGQQYKDHFSDYHDWDQRERAQEWMLFSANIGERLSIDETALSQGELYTIVTNKAAAGRKGALVAMIKGTPEQKTLFLSWKRFLGSSAKKLKK